MALINPYAARLQEFTEFVFDQHNDIQRLGGGWEDFFRTRAGQSPKKTILEIGCSNAFFLTDVAKAHPDYGFVGLDWKFKVIYRGAKNVEREGVKNVALIRGRVQDILSKIFHKQELDEVWIFFPDPWAKAAQLKHRLIRESFLMELQALLKPGGKIYFKTDHPGYFQWVLSIFGKPLPELPAYEAVAEEMAASGEQSRRARQVKVRKHEKEEDLPKTSDLVLKSFKFEASSINYWHEKIQPDSAFAAHQTLFEKLFIKDDLPIYYVSMSKLLSGS